MQVCDACRDVSHDRSFKDAVKRVRVQLHCPTQTKLLMKGNSVEAERGVISYRKTAGLSP